MTRAALAVACLALLAHGSTQRGYEAFRESWEEWWTYDGISGPAFWGLINPQWTLCSKGRRQSPIDVDPDKLLFDPLLRPLHIDKRQVSGTLRNTGQTLMFTVDKNSKHPVNISGGPLAYRYQFEEMYFHYGSDNMHGSEHRIHGHTFPGEIQLYGFNVDLYKNMSEAQHKSQGIVGISIMLQIRENPTEELRMITSTFNQIRFKGSSTHIEHLSLLRLLPNTDHYMTYEGSTTHPGCWETTVWIIVNKPIYISRQEMYSLRLLMQGTKEEPKAPLENNVRPPQHLHHRTVRANIDFTWSSSSLEKLDVDESRSVTDSDLRADELITEASIEESKSETNQELNGEFLRERNFQKTNSGEGKKCPSMHRDVHYKANTWIVPEVQNQ